MATKNISSTSSNGSSDLSSDLAIYQNYLKSSGLFKGIQKKIQQYFYPVFRRELQNTKQIH